MDKIMNMVAGGGKDNEHLHHGHDSRHAAGYGKKDDQQSARRCDDDDDSEDDDDFRGAAATASRHANEDRSFFKSVIKNLGQKKQQVSREDLDEEEAVKKHKKYFVDQDDNETADSRGLGAAAAMQALKHFSSGALDAKEPGAKTHSQSAFIGLAMSEASKLFDQKASQGRVRADTDKQSAVMQAGEMALRMYMKSKGDAPASGPSGLLNMAMKFM